ETDTCTAESVRRIDYLNRVLSDYISIARPDHWFKNIFVVPGIVFSWMAVPPTRIVPALVMIIMAFVAVCLVCSSNYTINEFLDAPEDRKHPVKRLRPAARGRIKAPFACLQWFLLGLAGLMLSWQISFQFFLVNSALLTMGLVYNVKPLRSKDVPYLDVLSESVNNPLRFLLGWYAFGSVLWPPVSLLCAYWMIGAFFMAAKRFAEIRHINDARVSASYRKSFAHYTPELLLVCILVYASAFAFFCGVFITRYKLELVLAIPIYSLFMGAYLRVAFRKHSPVQNPERLYKHKKLVLFCVIMFLVTILCLSVRVPFLHKIFETSVPGGF
ncbi:MAG: UbiA prenyltransferase family protein, partial [Planctomycetota bacterium]